MKKGEALFLNQLAKSLDEFGARLEEFYKKNDTENFNKAKSIMLNIQKKIIEVADA